MLPFTSEAFTEENTRNAEYAIFTVCYPWILLWPPPLKTWITDTKINLIPDPRPACCCLQYGKPVASAQR